jgi:hypothetical protein
MTFTGWAVAVLFGGIGALELLLSRLRRPTITQWVRRATRGRWWAKTLVVGLLAFLAWHFLWQPVGEWTPPPGDVPPPVEDCAEDC